MKWRNICRLNRSSIIAMLLSCLGLLTQTAMAETARDAQTIFQNFCFSCHGTGWEDAPVVGDSFAWEDRTQQGMDVLLKNTLNGINSMPPKGGCNDCSEDELRALIEWMIN